MCDFEEMEMNDFDVIKIIKSRIQALLEKLNWTEDDVLRDYNNIAEPNLEEEETWQNLERNLPESLSSENSVVLENKELQKLLNKPMAMAAEKFSDLQTKFSREEKLLLYEYTVNQKKDFHFLEAPRNDIVADIAAIRKREKKKQRKYRISKPSQKEELRSLIDLQMQALQELYESKQRTEICAEHKTRKFSTMENLKKDIETRQGERTSQNNKFQEKTTITEKCSKQTHKHKRSDKEHVSRGRRQREVSDNKSHRNNKHKSRSRTPNRIPFRHERRHGSRSRKRKKEKRKKSYKSSRHRLSRSPKTS